MNPALALLQIAGFLGIALACLRPRTRGGLAVVLLLLAAAALVQSVLAGSAERTLTITTTFPVYEGLNVTRKDFAVDEVTAPARGWGLLCGLFALAWAAWAWRQRRAGPSTPFGAPLALAWSGCALVLLLEKAAAPTGLLAPFDLGPDRVLAPATLAAALLLATQQQEQRQTPRVLDMVLSLTLYVAATRILLGLLATLATQNTWGTHLDIASIQFIAAFGQPVELAGGSFEQWWWLIAVPQLVVFPLIYMMSMGGIAFGVMMARKQGLVDRAAAVTVALLLLLLAPLAAQDSHSRPATTSTTQKAPRVLPGWVTDYPQACKVARSQGKDLLLGFVGYDWCDWCRRLRQEVFDTEAFRQRAPQAFVLVQVDRSRNQEAGTLQKQFGVQAYPSIYLADASGRPYARTGYREVGPEIYLGHLLELREIRHKRDDEFQKAAGATGPAKARYLAAGIDALGGNTPLDGYLPIIDEILVLDARDKDSLKTRFTEVKRRVLRERAMRELTRELDRLAAHKKWSEILAAVEKFKHEQEPTGPMFQELIWIEAVTCHEQGDREQARAKFDEVRKLDPNSDLGKQAQKAMGSLGK